MLALVRLQDDATVDSNLKSSLATTPTLLTLLSSAFFHPSQPPTQHRNLNVHPRFMDHQFDSYKAAVISATSNSTVTPNDSSHILPPAPVIKETQFVLTTSPSDQKMAAQNDCLRKFWYRRYMLSQMGPLVVDVGGGRRGWVDASLWRGEDDYSRLSRRFHVSVGIDASMSHASACLLNAATTPASTHTTIRAASLASPPFAHLNPQRPSSPLPLSPYSSISKNWYNHVPSLTLKFDQSDAFVHASLTFLVSSYLRKIIVFAIEIIQQTQLNRFNLYPEAAIDGSPRRLIRFPLSESDTTPPSCSNAAVTATPELFPLYFFSKGEFKLIWSVEGSEIGYLII